MRARRALVLVAFAVTVAGCATTGTPPPGGFVTKCKDIDLSGVSLDPMPLASWNPQPMGSGFLRIHYRWGPNPGPVYAIGILYESFQIQKLAFIVGPLPGFPDDWDPVRGAASAGTKEWREFFTRVRGASQNNRPGAVLCGGDGCGKPPDSPPPEFLGVGSSGSAAGSAALSGTSQEMYAQATRASTVASDAAFATSDRAERERIVKDLARNTCHGVQALLGKE